MSFRYFLAPLQRGGGEAVIPLPDLGEGGPVYPGDDPVVEPVIPLPDLEIGRASCRERVCTDV